MYVGLSNEFDERPGAEIHEQREAAADTYSNLQFYLKQGM